MKRWQVKYLKKNVNVSPPVHHTKMFEPTFFQQENIDPKTVRLVKGKSFFSLLIRAIVKLIIFWIKLHYICDYWGRISFLFQEVGKKIRFRNDWRIIYILNAMFLHFANFLDSILYVFMEFEFFRI